MGFALKSRWFLVVLPVGLVITAALVSESGQVRAQSAPPVPLGVHVAAEAENNYMTITCRRNSGGPGFRCEFRGIRIRSKSGEGMREAWAELSQSRRREVLRNHLELRRMLCGADWDSSQQQVPPRWPEERKQAFLQSRAEAGEWRDVVCQDCKGKGCMELFFEADELHASDCTILADRFELQMQRTGQARYTGTLDSGLQCNIETVIVVERYFRGEEAHWRYTQMRQKTDEDLGDGPFCDKWELDEPFVFTTEDYRPLRMDDCGDVQVVP